MGAPPLRSGAFGEDRSQRPGVAAARGLFLAQQFGHQGLEEGLHARLEMRGRRRLQFEMRVQHLVGGGGVGEGNSIVHNHSYGLYANGLCVGSVVQSNTIVDNTQGNVNLTNSKGITYIP